MWLFKVTTEISIIHKTAKLPENRDRSVYNYHCKSYHVDKSKLEELLQVCETVLKERENATELLPTQPGFFFGSTDYDEYYYNDCAKTVEIISNLLKEDNSEADFEYMASW